jgi:hypothetical protein
VRRLRQELELTQARLRTAREESDAANEELRAANEELQSIKEEYRSTSEELETSKEALQSINEQPQTVNTELKLKLEGISRANSDLQNLVAATDFGTLFLDSRFPIRCFTDRTTDLFSITSSDEGRPISDSRINSNRSPAKSHYIGEGSLASAPDRGLDASAFAKALSKSRCWKGLDRTGMQRNLSGTSNSP